MRAVSRACGGNFGKMRLVDRRRCITSSGSPLPARLGILHYKFAGFRIAQLQMVNHNQRPVIPDKLDNGIFQNPRTSGAIRKSGIETAIIGMPNV